MKQPPSWLNRVLGARPLAAQTRSKSLCVWAGCEDHSRAQPGRGGLACVVRPGHHPGALGSSPRGRGWVTAVTVLAPATLAMNRTLCCLWPQLSCSSGTHYVLDTLLGAGNSPGSRGLPWPPSDRGQDSTAGFAEGRRHCMERSSVHHRWLSHIPEPGQGRLRRACLVSVAFDFHCRTWPPPPSRRGRDRSARGPPRSAPPSAHPPSLSSTAPVCSSVMATSTAVCDLPRLRTPSPGSPGPCPVAPSLPMPHLLPLPLKLSGCISQTQGLLLHNWGAMTRAGSHTDPGLSTPDRFLSTACPSNALYGWRQRRSLLAQDQALGDKVSLMAVDLEHSTVFLVPDGDTFKDMSHSSPGHPSLGVVSPAVRFLLTLRREHPCSDTWVIPGI
ncbi:PREDICTED: uncharacterized protein LOC102012802 isoform X1 [Chinchilla lanigera]|uniref:uncharacterized protein LOC102012802 isoform X1 n=1 Tax=Chinchilla lanigera TaxID=34839 RepID=UPI00038EF715|nr:PREDICTED: uncharacterized protein LOC102012802 isoform X1 [Chinchilla lanigera]